MSTETLTIEEAHVEKPAVQPDPLRLWVPTILLIDDDPIFSNAFQRYALSKEVPVKTFEAIADIESVQNWIYDVVIMDYDLGSFNGVDFAEYINSKIGYVPTLMVSYKDRDQDFEEPWPDLIEGFSNKEKGLEGIFDDAIKTYAIGCMRRRNHFFR